MTFTLVTLKKRIMRPHLFQARARRTRSSWGRATGYLVSCSTPTSWLGTRAATLSEAPPATLFWLNSQATADRVVLHHPRVWAKATTITLDLALVLPGTCLATARPRYVAASA